ncbi:MAG TPA: sulfatase-like hydrolase/transferase [Candidatus Egerieousia sp.]|nr:sulfatase-like hydrolase/transferase [Candidatus Egerieousia sp.]HPT05750.1 sulfatase-like hydrolase/transferase [Candidatus Egerieousia sp.]
MKLKFNNYYLLILWRLVLAYVLYSICRILFIACNYSLIENPSFSQIMRMMGGGLRFDTTAILYTNILYIFFSFLPLPYVKRPKFQKILKWFYVIVNFLAVSVNLADTAYFRFSFRRTSMTFFSEFTGGVKIGKILADSFVMYWYLFALAFVFLILLIWLSGSYGKDCRPLYCSTVGHDVKYYNATDYGAKFYVRQAIALIITIPIFVIGVRGGATRTTRPITLSNAGQYVERSTQTAAVLNTPFCLIRTIGKGKYTRQDFYKSYEEAERYYTPFHSYDLGDALNNDMLNITSSTPSKMNVVVIILESFGAENMDFLNPSLNKQFTPFLDSLSREGILCTNAFANGRKSIDAVPSLLASIPSLLTPFIVTPYANDRIHGLPYILDSLGYHTAFFHGAPDNSMGIKAVTHLCGVQNYYGKTEFNDDSQFDGAWGIWDEPFLQFVGRTVSTFKEPFFTGVFTVSSHHPFKVPAKYDKVLPAGKTPLLKPVAYTDMALRKFFAYASKQPWFKRTIFVLSSDHGTFWKNAPQFANPIGNTRIPIIYYAPGFIKPQRYISVTQQIDVMPTVLDMIGYKGKFFGFGNSIIGEKHRTRFAINFSTDEFQMVKGEGDTLLIRGDKGLTAVYVLSKDPTLQHNLLAPGSVSGGTKPSAGPHYGHEANPGIRNAECLHHQDDFFKAVIQQYVNRLIDNRVH